MSAIPFTTLTRIFSGHAHFAILYDIASVWMETERGTTETSCSSDIRKSFFKLWPGFPPLVFRWLKEVLKSQVDMADAR